MEISYWKSRWRKDHTGWHMDEVYPPLKTLWYQLNLPQNATVLIPLCGKTLDIDWLAGQGHQVVGIDISEKAISILKDRLPYAFHNTSKGPLKCYKSDSVTLWCGDFFKLQPEWVPAIDAIYDKAALIALPPEKRSTYASHLQTFIQPHTQIFLNCFEYKQNEMSGPPFSVTRKELQKLYGQRFNLHVLHERSLLEELSRFKQRGLKSYLIEKIYHLYPK